MTYKKAIRLLTNILKEHGLTVSKTAQKQMGYLCLFATEGEISKNLILDLKKKLNTLPCKFEPGSLSDKRFLELFHIYAAKLGEENPDGGEISLGWILKESSEEEIWLAFAG